MKNSDSNKRIRELISELNISQTEFCKRTGINKSALSNYLNGDRAPRQDQIDKIAKAYDVNPAWLMGYDVPQKELKDITAIVTDNNKVIFKYKIKSDLYAQLLDVAQNCTEDQVKMAKDMLAAFAQTNRIEEYSKRIAHLEALNRHKEAITRRKEVKKHGKGKKIT